MARKTRRFWSRQTLRLQALKTPQGEEEPQRRPQRKVGRKPIKCMSPKPSQESLVICFDDIATRHMESRV